MKKFKNIINFITRTNVADYVDKVAMGISHLEPLTEKENTYAFLAGVGLFIFAIFTYNFL